MNQEPQFQRVSELAACLKKPVAVYDLEATTFRGQANFGITEVACFVVYPQGPGVTFSSLIDPERPISADAERLTGITQKMVSGQQTWGVRYAGLFKQMAEGQCYVTGFNNSTFDNAAVRDMNARYGQPFDEFRLSFDIRRLHLSLHGLKSQAGSLVEVATAYGIQARSDAHRAMADVLMTLETLNAIIELFGVDEVVQEIQKSKGKRSVKALNQTNLVKYVNDKSGASIDELVERFGKDKGAVSFELGKAIDERQLDPLRIQDVSVVTWTVDALGRVREESFDGGRLKPIFEELQTMGAPAGLDYIQLRVALLQAGRTWASLKPKN